MKKAISILLCAALFAVFCAVPAGATSLHPFSDVVPGSWYEHGVIYAYEKGMMVGTSKTEFSPNTDTTRAMIVTILYRLEGSPEVERTDSFTDVPDNEWYSDAVAWAAQKHIVDGYGNGKFGPQDSITRQQLAAILYRYTAYKGMSVSANGWASSYPDVGSVSTWAVAAMQWAVKEGYITGSLINGQVFLLPEASASRAQIATILMRYLNSGDEEAIDLSALEAYGREYATSLGFTIDTAMTPDNSSYYPGDRVLIRSMEDGRRLVAENVQVTADNLIGYGNSIAGYRCNILIEKGAEGEYIIWVMYG
ncbi:MAG: S-layer homology domain-containing protein [Oscillospiraceae bacterium]|nr:S-layer homology domain-containing protein [Oscillospiraceae bacterium]